MLGDPAYTQNNLILDGSISAKSGMFGFTASFINASSLAIIEHVPGTTYSDYYFTYPIVIDADGVFRLAPIGVGGVALGHILQIEGLQAGGGFGLTINDSSDSIVGRIFSGGKILLTAIGSPNIWKTSYVVPEGIDNYLIVYEGKYPKVDLLPIKKEFDYNSNFEYGIKSVESYDINEPATLMDVSNYTNPHKILLIGSENSFLLGITAATTLVSSIIGCKDSSIGISGGDSSLYSGIIAGSSGCSFEDPNGSEALGIIASFNSSIDCSSGISGLVKNCFVASSINSTVQSNVASILPLNQVSIISCNDCSPFNILSSIENATIMNSLSSMIRSGQQMSVLSTENLEVSGLINSSVLSSNDCNIAGDLTIASENITILSSDNIALSTSGFTYDRCVIGGVNVPTWSIDSKTGVHYGSGFNSSQPLPGLAEFYENLTIADIPYGRLLRLNGDKVRLCTKGEFAHFVSRPYSSSVFIGNDPYLSWQGMFLKDVFGEDKYKDYTYTEYVDILKNVFKLTDKMIENKHLDQNATYNMKEVNPAYDPNVVYVPRNQRRSEWTVCEKIGIIVVEHDGTLKENNYVVSGPNGIATNTTRKTNIRVTKVIDAQYAKVDIVEDPGLFDVVEFIGTRDGGYITGIPADFAIDDITFTDSSITFGSDKKITLMLAGMGSFAFQLEKDGATIIDTFVDSATKGGLPATKVQLNAVLLAGTYRMITTGVPDGSTIDCKILI